MHAPVHPSWVVGLAQFLQSESGVEAILFDADSKKVSIATLGPVNADALAKRLRVALRDIESGLPQDASGPCHSANPPPSIHVRPIPGKTLIEKPTCITAPRFWIWRDIAWHEPGYEPAAEGTPSAHTHAHDWRVLAALATLCGVLGLAGLVAETWLGAPPAVVLGLFIASMIAGGWEAASEVLHHIPRGKLDVHFLMLCVALGATFIGAWREGALLLFLFSLSGALEHFALHRTLGAIESLFKLAPQVATVLEGATQEERVVPIQQVLPGQVLLIKPGGIFPVDAEVLVGETAADEAHLTGESVPVQKAPGDTVWSGTLNLWGAVQARVLRPASQSALQKIIRLIQEAQHLKAPSQRFTEKFGTTYTYAILLATLVMFLVWWWGMKIDPWVSTPGSYSAFYRAMTLLVVASPCALVLSIPSAILAAIAWGARHGILFRGGGALEKLAQIDTVALDKTGTLTTGELQVCSVESFPAGQEDRVLQLAYTLEKKAHHPLAQAIVAQAKKQGLPEATLEQFRSLVGQGVQGKVDAATCVLGRRELLKSGGALAPWVDQLPEPPEDQTEVWVMYPGLLGRILLKDTVRQASVGVLQALRRLKLHTLMLTGDRRKTAEVVGYALGIQEIRAGLHPADKVDIVAQLQAKGKKVAMLGDGVNDAPCLAAAYVSVAMGARGSDAALEQSEVVLMHDRIDAFLDAYFLSQRTRAIVHQNIALSLGTIGVMVLAVSFGMIPLSVGVFAHEGSTVLVCLNSLRLLLGGKKSAHQSP
jgi:Cd2+/Zn2+-exporting ATPase